MALPGASTDILSTGGLVIIGLVVRWPNLLTSPPFPAVARTVLLALAVAEGRAWPLADQAPYLGTPLVYLLAGIYRVFGPSLEATMLLTWVLGALTVVPAYLLGKELGGPIAGGIAGALLATSPAHTVISSHVPWVHSLTPLLSTLSLWLLARAILRRESRSLLLAGVLIGVTLQTHPTAFPLLAGASLAVALSLRLWREIRVAALFILCMTAGYSPLLAHHLQTRFEVVDDIHGKQARYLDADPDPDERAEQTVYMNNLEQLGASVVRLTAGELRDTRPTPVDYLRDPGLLVYALLGLTGLLLGRRRAGLFLLAGVILAVLLPPFLNGKYKPILDGRYLMPIVPVLFVGIGCLASRLGKSMADTRAAGPIMLLIIVLTASFTIGSLSRLSAYYEDSMEDGASNRLYLREISAIREQLVGEESVWLDPRLREVKMPGGANAGSTFSWLLPVSRISSVELPADSDWTSLTGQLAIVHRSTANELRQTVGIQHLDGFSMSGKDQPSFRLVRIQPA